MPGNRFDARNIVQHIAEGRGEEALKERATYRNPDPAHPTFVRFVVLDVIADPTVIDSKKLSYWENTLKVANIQIATVAPRNSIIARPVMRSTSGASDKVMVLYPFCPPSISMPAKPGEHVWGMFEDPGAKVNEIGYWLWKVVQPDFVEDVNYTHADRSLDPSFLPGLVDVFEGTADPKYEFHNGGQVKDMTSGTPYTIAETSTLPADPLGQGVTDADKAYELLIASDTGAEAARVAQYEPVPRYRKRPQDTAFEGSNNTLIVLGTDRSGPWADTSNVDPNQGTIPAPVKTDTAGPGAGAIDIVAGRGQTADTLGKAVQNSLNNKELGKDKQNLSPKEGDPDPINDRSRILIAQKTKGDTNFGTASVIAAQGNIAPGAPNPADDSDGYGYVVVKTDKIRLIARSDVVIMVTQDTGGSPPKDANGNLADPGTGGASLSPDHCASIIVRANGDIIFTPSKKGVVKLGGDGANLAVLCQMATTGATDESGNVTAPPIIDTMFGSQGGGGVAGQFATKVLLK